MRLAWFENLHLHHWAAAFSVPVDHTSVLDPEDAAAVAV